MESFNNVKDTCKLKKASEIEHVLEKMRNKQMRG
jgi:hypothetical protein